MPSRREFLKLIPPASLVVVGNSLAKADEADKECEYYARGLAEAMRKKHGGTPVIIINHRIALAQVIVT